MTPLRSPERDAILQTLRRAEKPLSPSEVAAILGRTRNSTKKLMWSMAKRGEILALGDGRYRVVTAEGERETTAVTPPLILPHERQDEIADLRQRIVILEHTIAELQRQLVRAPTWKALADVLSSYHPAQAIRHRGLI